MVKTRRFGHSWPFSWAIGHSFSLRTRFERLMTPGKRKLVCPQNSSIWSFWPFSWAIAQSFWLRRRFQRLVTPRYTKNGTSSKLVDFVNSGRFHGQLHTIFFGSGTISTAHVHKNWDVVKTRRFCHFWLFSWAIAHSFWFRRRFQRLVTPST